MSTPVNYCTKADLTYNPNEAMAYKASSTTSTTSTTAHKSMMKLIVDSGASFHVHNHIEDLINVRPCSAKIIGIDHEPHEIKSIGDLPVKALDSLGLEYDLLIKMYATPLASRILSFQWDNYGKRGK